MDLIYSNENMEDIGVLEDFQFDLAFGSDENDFELTLNRKNGCCKAGYIIYMEGTEYGGIIDKIKTNSQSDSVIYMGRTWHGILEGKVIEADLESGSAYYSVSGEANTVLSTMIEKLGLKDLFEADSTNSEINISYTFDRYAKGYTGIKKMLASANAKLKMSFRYNKLILSAVPIVDYSQDEEFDSDLIEMEIEKVFNGTNHLICLGKGELLDREVIHLYVDENGEISTTQTFFGKDEIADAYDYSNAESTEELKKGGIEKLKEQITDSASFNLNAELDAYGVGDIVGSKDIETGISVVASIIKKIVTINSDMIKIEYEVGEIL